MWLRWLLARALLALATYGSFLLVGCVTATPRGRPPPVVVDTSSGVAPAPAPRFFLAYASDVLVAAVTVYGEVTGDSVDIRREGHWVKVALRHRGNALLTPLPIPKTRPPMTLVFEEMHLQGDPRASLLAQALEEDRYNDVQLGLDATDALDRDNVSLALVTPLNELELARIDKDERGSRLLVRFLGELSSGHVTSDELREVHRILATMAQRLTPEAFAEAVLSSKTKIFSHKQTGFTVWSDAPITAKPWPDGKVQVSLPARSLAGTRNLPGPVFDVPEDEPIGVALDDERGRVQFAPALILVQISNADEAHAVMKGLEAVGFGILAPGALGPAALIEAGVESRAVARVLMWCDRGAAVLAVVGTVLDEHRGFILSEFGDEGRDFLRYADTVNAVVAYYGMARMAMAAPKLVLGFRGAYGRFKARARALAPTLEPAQSEVFEQLGVNAEEFFRRVEEIRASAAGTPPPVEPPSPVLHSTAPRNPGAKVISIKRSWEPGPPPEAGAQSLPAVHEEPLALTGTDGRLVEIPQQGMPPDTAVASAHRGGAPGVPQRPGPMPPRQPGPATPGGPPSRYGKPAVEKPSAVEEGPPFRVIPGSLAAEATEAEILAVKFAETEVEEVATGARQTAVLEDLEKLRPAVERPPAGTEVGDNRWHDYVEYWNKRYNALVQHRLNPAGEERPAPPLTPEAYDQLMDRFWRGRQHQHRVTSGMRGEAGKPPEQRTMMRNMEEPQVDENLGVMPDGALDTFYGDQVVVDKKSLGPGKEPHVESYSNKCHNFDGTAGEARAQVRMDAAEAHKKYDGILEIRRRGHPLFGRRVEVKKVHLVYEADLVPDKLRKIILDAADEFKIEVHFR